MHQHDVRAKQTKVCDAERAEFRTPSHASNYWSEAESGNKGVNLSYHLATDGQLKLAAVFPPVDNMMNNTLFSILKAKQKEELKKI